MFLYGAVKATGITSVATVFGGCEKIDRSLFRERPVKDTW
jgi:hypothetical protein